MTLGQAASLVLFLGAASLAGWTVLGYPVFIALLARLRPRPVARGPFRPFVSIVMPVHNEARFIDAKLDNLGALDYPVDRREILVASDGSTDATETQVLAHGLEGLRLLSLPRGGKGAALDAAGREARGEVLVFTDATPRLGRDSLTRLVENLADPDVGGVCGHQVYRRGAEEDATAQGEGAYWGFDTWVKVQESRTGSIFASDGSLHALRACHWRPLGERAGSDDILLSAQVVLDGCRLVYEPRALCFEEPPASAAAEFRRKVRVTRRSVTALLSLGPALWTRRLWSLKVVSHKLLRHLLPLLLLVTAGTSLHLAWWHPFFAVLAGAHGLVGLLGLAGFLLRRHRLGALPALAVPAWFCLANAAALVGLLGLVAGRRVTRWEPRGGGAPETMSVSCDTSQALDGAEGEGDLP